MPRRTLALTYRPQTFDEVVGQEVSVRILKNLVVADPIHPAILLTGPRGVGKTSLARIFAKAVNCEKGPTPIPCGGCLPCREITEGRSLSVLEIDGASNTSVDDVRELRERIRYLPAGGRYKIYIIDEVHMLSTAAFNALLKTLEEPPSHALFVFATTEPHKVPITIVSRCLRFDLKSIPVSLLVRRLKEIATREGLEVEEEAFFEIARESQGSLRDSLGLLEQASSYASKVDRAVLEGILGASPLRHLRPLFQGILERNPAAVLESLRLSVEAGVDMKRFGLEILEGLRHLIVSRISEDPNLFDLPVEEIAWFRETALQVSADTLPSLFRMVEQTLPGIQRASNPRILLEVLLLQLCRYPELESIEKILRRLEEMKSGGASQLTLAAPVPSLIKPVPPQDPTDPRPVTLDKRSEVKGWGEFLATAREKRPQIASLLEMALGVEVTPDQVAIAYSPGSIQLEMLKEADRLHQLEDLLSRFFGHPLRVVFEERKGESPSLIDDAVSIFQPRDLKTVRSP